MARKPGGLSRDSYRGLPQLPFDLRPRPLYLRIGIRYHLLPVNVQYQRIKKIAFSEHRHPCCRPTQKHCLQQNNSIIITADSGEERWLYQLLHRQKRAQLDGEIFLAVHAPGKVQTKRLHPVTIRNNTIKTLLRILIVLPAILFVVTGLRWAVDPSSAAAALGMSLMDGVGRSSQIGDVGALFLAMGIMILLALITSRRNWFYAPALMLVLVAILRVIAWLAHDAALTLDMIVVELVVAGLLLLASSRLSQAD
jgi:hypothetical protein